MQIEEKLKVNEKDWDVRYAQFAGWCALPTWGPFETAKDDPTLIGDIKGKTFLEVACGSGHSVKYLLENGAKKVYAMDISENQLKHAKELNKKWIELGQAEFFQSPMELKVSIPEKVDVVFSVYGIGWTLDADTTFSNIFSYLKPGGKFVWSWDHAIFSDSNVEDDKVVVKGSYHDEDEFERITKSTGNQVYTSIKKASTWFAHLRKAGFVVNRYLEPVPINLNEDISRISSPEMAKYYSPLKAEKLPCVVIFECFKPQ